MENAPARPGFLNALATYGEKRILVVLLLGFSSGLPRVLIASTLFARLLESGVDIKTIGLFGYVAMPYIFKFLWAPLVDTLPIPLLTRLLGQRVGWMVGIQVLLACGMAWMAMIDAAQSSGLIALAALIVAFLSASQDIVIDAYRTEYVPKESHGPAAAAAVFGYRIGMLVAGAGALALSKWVAWENVYLLMAGLMAVGMATVLLAGEPEATREPPEQFGSLKTWCDYAVIAPFRSFVTAYPAWPWVLGLILCYNLSDGFIGQMSTPFLMVSGYDKTAIAAVGKLYGFAATLFGFFIGGAALARFGQWKAMMLFAFLQLLANMAYLVITVVGPELWALMFAISVDNFAGGCVSAAMVAFLMRLCQHEHTATQYALLSALASVAGIMLSGGSGWIASNYGWQSMFLISASLGIPAVLLLLKLKYFITQTGQSGSVTA